MTKNVSVALEVENARVYCVLNINAADNYDFGRNYIRIYNLFATMLSNVIYNISKSNDL